MIKNSLIIIILLFTILIPITESNNGQVSPISHMGLGKETYYNASIALITVRYNVKDMEDDYVYLSSRNILHRPGLLIIYNETKTWEFNRAGGWIHSYIEFFGYKGYFKFDKPLLMMFGDFDKIIIQTGR